MNVANKLDRAKGKLSGSAKELEGKLTGDKLRETQGKAEKILSQTKEKIDESSEQIQKKVSKVKQEATHK